MRLTYSICILFTIFFSTGVSAKKVVIGSAEKIKTVADLPQTEAYAFQNGAVTAYIDLGIKYTEFQLSRLPLWITEDPVFIGVVGNQNDLYLELTPEEVDEIIKVNHLNKEELLKLSFTEKHLGLIILIVLIIVIFCYYSFIRKKPKNHDIIEEKES